MSDSSTLHRSFERHVRTVTSLTMVSRVSGLARDASLSRVFGIGPVLDAFAFGFMVPNLFRRLFGEGALSAPSPNRRRKRFGTMKPNAKASITGPMPKTRLRLASRAKIGRAHV